MSKLGFGYLYDFRNPAPWRRPGADLYAELLDFIAWTETLGFAAAWVPEHHGAGDAYMPSPLVALGAIAARTKQMKIGSAVALAPFYHPVRFAEDTAVLDILAGGRLELTLAIGYRRREADAYGLDFTARGRRTDEFLAIVQRLWAGETVAHEGTFFTLKNAKITPTPINGRIPLFLGGFTDKALDRTARLADGYFGNIEVCDLYRAKLRAHGKDPAAARIRLLDLFLVVARDPDKALHELAPYFHHVNNTYGEWANEDRAATGFEDTAMTPMTLEAFKASGQFKVLTPAQAIAMFKDLRAKAPVEHFMLMVPPGLPTARFAPYAELFAKEVIPAFA